MFTKSIKNIIVNKNREEVTKLKNKGYIFGNTITIQRKKKKLTQGQLAEKLNVTNQAISKWENGKSFPTMKNIINICGELEIEYKDIIEILFEEQCKKVQCCI